MLTPRVFHVLIFLSMFIGAAFSSTIILSNDSDWRSAYILGYYASKKGYGFLALYSEASAREVFPYLLNKDDNIVIYSGPNPVVKNYGGFLRGKGFENVRTVSFRSPYDLMFDVPEEWGLDLRSAVLVADSGGEWVLMAGPLAYASDSYMLLLNNKTKDRILQFIRGRSFDSIYVIGYAGKSLREELPGATFVATGNRARDSVEVAKILRSFVPYSQVYVLSGLFLYLPSKPFDVPKWTGGKGRYPILISYVNGLPEATLSFLKNDYVQAAEFVGLEMVSSKDDAKEALPNKRVVALFAFKYENVPTREQNRVFPLPAFLLPTADLSITLESATALIDGRILLKLRNDGSSAGYVMPTFLRVECQEGYLWEITPQETAFIDANDSTVIEYNSGQVIPMGNCFIYVEGVYGADRDRMDFEFDANIPLELYDVADNASIEVTKIVYSPRLERFIIYVKNLGDVPAYVTVSIHGVLIDGVPRELKTEQVQVPPGSTKEIYIKARLTDADLLDNAEIKYSARFGENPDLLVHMISGTLPLLVENLQFAVITFVIEYALVIIALILLFLFILFMRRRKKDGEQQDEQQQKGGQPGNEQQQAEAQQSEHIEEGLREDESRGETQQERKEEGQPAEEELKDGQQQGEDNKEELKKQQQKEEKEKQAESKEGGAPPT